jgi:hypothetical protein
VERVRRDHEADRAERVELAAQLRRQLGGGVHEQAPVAEPDDDHPAAEGDAVGRERHLVCPEALGDLLHDSSTIFPSLPPAVKRS